MIDWAAVGVVTAPVGAPVSVESMKGHLRIRSDDDYIYLSELIAAAVALIDGPKGIGFALLPQTWRYTLDRFPSGVIELPGAVVSGVTSVAYFDLDGAQQTLDVGGYRFHGGRKPARIEPVEDWPDTQDRLAAVEVTYTLGAVSPEPDLIHAIKMIVAHWYENREEYSSLKSLTKVPLGASHLMMRHSARLA